MMAEFVNRLNEKGLEINMENMMAESSHEERNRMFVSLRRELKRSLTFDDYQSMCQTDVAKRTWLVRFMVDPATNGNLLIVNVCGSD